jgi:hypothetical protein
MWARLVSSAYSENALPHQQRADRSLWSGARTLRSRHSVLVRSRAIAYAVLPSVRSRTTRATTSSGVDLGLQRTTPWSRRKASASRVRLRMKSRSSSAKTTAMCAIALPIGVRVSIPSCFRVAQCFVALVTTSGDAEGLNDRHGGASARCSLVRGAVELSTGSEASVVAGSCNRGCNALSGFYSPITVHD